MMYLENHEHSAMFRSAAKKTLKSVFPPMNFSIK